MQCGPVFSPLLALACSAAASGPQEAERIPGKRLLAPPTIDGVINLEEWQEAASFEGLFDGNDGKPAPVNSRFYLAYDDTFIYFAAKNLDPEPKAIRAVEYRTNSGMPGDDSVELSLDVSGSLNQFAESKANPAGATDMDLPGGRAAKREWAGEFLAKSRITEEGWETEMRIPWNVMLLPGQGKRNLRLGISRFVARLSRGYTHVYTPEGRPDLVPYWMDVEIPASRVQKTLKLLPYVYAGQGEEEGTILNSGLDLKSQITDSIALVGTINPDFRNIENQILSLDFSRFERLADESRPFFLEGLEYTDSSIFTSQVIGKFDAGINAYGRLGSHTSFGLIDTIDFGNENTLATSFSYEPDAYNSYRAAFHSLSRLGLENTAYMLRYGRGIGTWWLNARTSGSQDSEDGFGADHQFSVGSFNKNVSFNANYIYRENDFYPKLGFFPERNYKGFGGRLGWFRPLNTGPTRFQGFNLFFNNFRRINGDPYRDGMGGFGFITLRNRFGIEGNFNTSTFEGQKDTTYGFGMSYPDNDPYRNQGFGITKGKIGEQDYELLSYRANFRPFRRLQMNLSHQRFTLGESTEQTILGMNYDLGNDRSISGRAVRSGDDLNWYAAFRQSGNRGAEYYLIVGDPNAERFTKSLILKFVLPFEISLGPSNASKKKQISP